MVVYKYKGLYKNKIISGSIYDTNFSAALATLNYISIKPISVSKSIIYHRVSAQDFHRWLEHLITLLSNGFHIKEAIAIMSENSFLSSQIAIFTNQNKSFTEAVKYHRHLLPKNFCHILGVMTRFTSVEEALKFFINFQNTTVEDIKRELLTLYWPLIQLLIALIILFLISYIGQIVLKPMEEDLGVDLPSFFYIFDGFHKLHFILLLVIACLIFVTKLWKRIRFINDIYMHIHCYTTFSLIGHAMQKGVPIKEAVLMAINIKKSDINTTSNIYRHLIRGNNIYECFRYANVSHSQCEIMRIAEKVGSIEQGFYMSAKVSAYQINENISHVTRFIKYFSTYGACAAILYVFFRGLLAITTNILEKYL